MGWLVTGLSLFSSPQLSNGISKPPIGIMPIGIGLVFFPHGLIDFLPQHPDFPRRGNPQPDLVAGHTDHGDHNVVADGETLAGSATQYQHGILLLDKAQEAGHGSTHRFIGKARRRLTLLRSSFAPSRCGAMFFPSAISSSMSA